MDSVAAAPAYTQTSPADDYVPVWGRVDQVKLLAGIISPFADPHQSMRLAYTLIQRFGSLPDVIAAAPERLLEVDGVDRRCAELFGSVYATVKGVADLRLVADAPKLNSYEAVLNYCRATMAFEPIETFKVLFLNTQHRLIVSETMQAGTVAFVPVYVREVLRRTVELNATLVILAHNHPSGESTPSTGDIEMTSHIATALDYVRAKVVDHLIVGRFGATSLRSWVRNKIEVPPIKWAPDEGAWRAGTSI